MDMTRIEYGHIAICECNFIQSSIKTRNWIEYKAIEYLQLQRELLSCSIKTTADFSDFLYVM